MNIALILLGGKGSRIGGDIPKQFIKKDFVPIYVDAINKYQALDQIDKILLVVNRDYITQVREDIKKYELNKVIDVIEGGCERFISSFLGLEYLVERYGKNNNVLIADAVRPNTSKSIIINNIKALDNSKAVLTAIEGPGNEIRIDTCHFKGSKSYRAQTPQSFKLGYIYDLYKRFINDEQFFPTDDINLVELALDPYVIVPGEEENYKITNPDDLKRYLNKK